MKYAETKYASGEILLRLLQQTIPGHSSVAAAPPPRHRPSESQISLVRHLGLNEVQDTLSTAKGVCNRFVRTLPGLKYDSHTPCILEGSCQYGDSCKYYHPKKSLPNMNTQGVEALLFGNPTGTSLGNLPPSLWPPPEGGYPPLPFIDWG
ncbi:hypothetical protein OROMI_014434 [Orobanche minor]